MKKTLLVSALLALLGAIGGYFVAQGLDLSGTIELPDENVLSLALTIQAGVITFVLSLIGLLLQKKTSFQLIAHSKARRGAGLAILFGLLTGFMIIAGDAALFSKFLPELETNPPAFSLSGLLGGVFYGGVVEEVMMRLFGMTLIIFLISKLRKGKNPSNKSYWLAIILTSLLFAVGHLPANALIFGELSFLVTTRAILLNGIGGMFFGYLYWKHGFWFSVLSHMMAHVGMQMIFIPMFY
ncbi:CPBP family intramembrane glutamic endopeptidase [Pseudalkalibacillus hwajinpoensis]|uniref:CPBP family intramembrane glutamic endopeptidase n=1 Tax=Guptibacillus hwajinpoensis TaxID=208199 RepID=UPI001CD58542|nr:CPBP family intramembrane glutamic endopeptidase [Pseudalkalibacillus hwajinpoensis]MCA0991445.1 CPBP family intramembrane metalloprotease [Pseudalkalibacillus hwajinpoensis]